VPKAKPRAPKQGAHALLGASSAHRWLHCLPSARLCEDMPDTGSPYAHEGTLAHELAALKLGQAFTEARSKTAYSAARAKLLGEIGKAAVLAENGGTAPRTDETTAKRAEASAAASAEAAVGVYVDMIRDDHAQLQGKPNVFIEQRVDYAHVVPEGFGTCDCILIGQGLDGQWQLRIYDYKHGKGVPVEAEGNPQLMLYALGALALFAPIYPITLISMTICQPRRDSLTSWAIPTEELLAWGEHIRPLAQQAHQGEGDLQEGDWCQFCPRATRCRERAERFVALEAYEYRLPGDPRDPLTDAELGDVLAIGERLDKWLSALRKHVQDTLLAGGTIPGWKLVEGRTVRAFGDLQAAFQLAKDSGVKEELLYVREPITLTALESLMGKKAFTETLAAQIIRKPGKPTLAPESDPRPAMTRKSAADDFAEDTPRAFFAYDNLDPNHTAEAYAIT